MAERVPPPPDLVRYLNSIDVPQQRSAVGAAVPPAPAPARPLGPAPRQPLRPRRPWRLAALLSLLLVSLAALVTTAADNDIAAAKAVVAKLVADLTDPKRALPH